MRERDCVQSALACATEAWAMERAGLHSLGDETDGGGMEVRGVAGGWGRSVDLCSLLGVRSVAEVVGRGGLGWFGRVERGRMVGCRPAELWWWRG